MQSVPLGNPFDSFCLNFRISIRIQFYINLTKIMQDYALSNSVEMILKKEDILIGKNNLDITKEIMNLFNKNVKVIKIK